MSLQNQIQNLAVRIGTECKAIRAAAGDKASLTTTDKSSLVAAINELKSALASAAGILDTATTGDTAHTWSANKIIAEINAAKSAILNGAPAAYDTLVEIASALSADDSDISGLLTAVGNRVRFDAVQTLDMTQKALKKSTQKVS